MCVRTFYALVSLVPPGIFIWRKMSKDPAVLFYTSDFLSGTSFFTYEQKGQYITLLCQQHQLWEIPENHMISVCGSLDSPVIKKFVCENGFYYNKRMRIEAEKRANYCSSRSNNKSGRPKKKIIRKSYENHMENENENENINKIRKIKHGEYKHVLLTEKEHFCLINDFGKEKTERLIKMLDEGIELKGYKYKNCNLAIRKWEKNTKQEKDPYESMPRL